MASNAEEVLFALADKIKASRFDVLHSLADKINATRNRSIDIFRKIDVSGDGCVSMEEFKAGIAGLGIDLAEGELVLLMKMTDRDNSGDVSLKEFDRGLKRAERSRHDSGYGVFAASMATPIRKKPPPKAVSAPAPAAPTTQAWTPRERFLPMDAGDEALWKFKCHLSKFKIKMLDVHRSIDELGVGDIGVDDLYHGLCRVGAPLTDEEFDALVASVGKDRRDRVKVENFDKALKVADRKAKAEGRTVDPDSAWSSASRDFCGLTSSFDWATRSVCTTDTSFACGLPMPLSTGSTWSVASAGPLHAAQAMKIHCGNLQDSSIGRQRLFDSSFTPFHLPPATASLASPRLPLHETVHPGDVVETRFGREPVKLPAHGLASTKGRCFAAQRALRPVCFGGRVRQISGPMNHSSVNDVIFHPGAGSLAEEKLDTSLFEGCRGVPSWRHAVV
mmetsp:Transcript_19590/g.54823  ORF Transcript_19590/g.54823 Transcript_19590/m.54823 type:complete len:448 (-) Transcript_19590:56-1399(-)